MAVRHALPLLVALGWATAAVAQQPETPSPAPPPQPNAPAPAQPASPVPAEPGKPAPPASPAGPAAAAVKAVDGPDTWIFSGALQGTGETFSATLVADKTESQFEMKLAGGATCDGGKLKGDVGLVRLPEITCSDDRAMRALFVPQAGKILRVFGHVGDQRFVAEAHLLGTEAPPEAKQTAQPKGPLGLPPQPPRGAPPTPPNGMPPVPPAAPK